MQPMQGYFYELNKNQEKWTFCIFFFRKAINVRTLQDLTDPPQKILKMVQFGESWCIF